MKNRDILALGMACAISDDKRITVLVDRNDNMQGFARVSIAYCDDNDKPKKKTGRVEAYEKMLDGQCILVSRNAYPDLQDIANNMLELCTYHNM